MSRVHNGTAELKKILENYIYEMGINEIARVSETALTVSLYCDGRREARRTSLLEGRKSLRGNHHRYSQEILPAHSRRVQQ